MNRNRRRRETRERIIEEAKRHVGYRAQPERRSAFTDGTRHTGKAWNGLFIQRVLRDAFGTEPEVSFASTVTALGFYMRTNRVYTRTVRPGDVVFFNFATDPTRWYEQPHVGVVIEVRPNGSFRTVEGETGPGVPQGSQLIDGVFIRDRQPSDILGTVRPEARTVNAASAKDPTKLRLSYFESNGKTVARAVETVQLALHKMNGAFTFNRGKRDGVFKSALGLYSRESGTVESRGEISPAVLKRLADETGTFEVEPS